MSGRRVLECMICGAFFLSSLKGFIDGDLNAFLGYLCAGMWVWNSHHAGQEIALTPLRCRGRFVVRSYSRKAYPSDVVKGRRIPVTGMSRLSPYSVTTRSRAAGFFTSW